MILLTRFKRLSPFKRIMIGALAFIFLVVAGFSGVVAIQARINQEFFANQAAETLRVMFGEKFVARLETRVYRTKERVRKYLYARPGEAIPEVLEAVESSRPFALASSDSAPRDPAFPPPATVMIQSPPMKNEGNWTELKAKKSGMFTAQIRPDERDVSKLADLIAIDLTQLKIVFVPGTEITEKDDLSRIPKGEMDGLVAVFNGGFRSHHTLTMGQRKNGVEFGELQDDLAAIIMPADGATRILKWDKATAEKYAAADVRQNLMMLVDDGKIEADFLDEKHLDYATYRTGLGITDDNRWLIYAGGDNLKLTDVARALKLAHCNHASFLDQNTGNVMFEIASGDAIPPVLRGINPRLHHEKYRKFFEGSDRDFFYIVQRSRS